MVREVTPEERDSCIRIAKNPAFKGPVKAFVGELANEGVLGVFIDCDKLVAINLLLEAKGVEATNILTRENYNNAFAAMLLGHIWANIRKEPGEEVTDEDFKEALDEYIDNVRWSRFFEIFWGYSYMMAEQAYKLYVKAYKNAEGTNQNEKETIDKLFNDAFPAEKGLKIPTRKWEEEHESIRDLFDLALYLEDDYIDEVFGSIQRINKKPVSSDMRETIDIMATSCLELVLFEQALKELDMSDNNADADALQKWLETVKVEKSLYIKALYYLFAHKCYALLAAKK